MLNNNGTSNSTELEAKLKLLIDALVTKIKRDPELRDLPHDSLLHLLKSALSSEISIVKRTRGVRKSQGNKTSKSCLEGIDLFNECLKRGFNADQIYTELHSKGIVNKSRNVQKPFSVFTIRRVIANRYGSYQNYISQICQQYPAPFWAGAGGGLNG